MSAEVALSLFQNSEFFLPVWVKISRCQMIMTTITAGRSEDVTTDWSNSIASEQTGEDR